MLGIIRFLKHSVVRILKIRYLLNFHLILHLNFSLFYAFLYYSLTGMHKIRTVTFTENKSLKK